MVSISRRDLSGVGLWTAKVIAADFGVIIEKIQVMYLAGKKVDYDEVDGEIGFVFRDPN